MKPMRLGLLLTAALVGLAGAQPTGPPGGLPPISDAEARAALAGIDLIAPGTSVAITSVDLTVIHASGQVGPDGTLRLGSLPAGIQVRIVVGLVTGGAQVSPRVFEGTVDASGRAVLIRTSSGFVDLARALVAFGVRLEVR
jgi:hypothetical protein